MSACFQNAWLLLHGLSTPIITFRERPCMPAKGVPILEKNDCSSVKVLAANGTIVEWFKDGTVHETLQNGDTTIFPAKPTYSTFMRGSYTFANFFMGYLSFEGRTDGNYFEFHRGGAVIYRNSGISFLWSPEFPAKEVEGTLSHSIFCDFDDQEEDNFWRCERRDSYS